MPCFRHLSGIVLISPYDSDDIPKLEAVKLLLVVPVIILSCLGFWWGSSAAIRSILRAVHQTGPKPYWQSPGIIVAFPGCFAAVQLKNRSFADGNGSAARPRAHVACSPIYSTETQVAISMESLGKAGLGPGSCSAFVFGPLHPVLVKAKRAAGCARSVHASSRI